jgi:endonuclease IV
LGSVVVTYVYGQHVQGGAEMVKGLRHAIDTGAPAAQVFPGSQLSYEVCKRFTYETEMRTLAQQLDLTVHGAYFLVITQPPGEKRTKSIEGTIRTLQWAEDVGAKRVVIHPGSMKDPYWAGHAEGWLRDVWHGYRGPVELLLETAAGKTSLGRDLADLETLCDSAYPGLGICVDLTHSWSAGYGIGALAALPERFGSLIRACHFNVPNQGVKQGSGIDKHHHGFHQTDWSYHDIEWLWRTYRHVPCILEGTPTPERDYELLRSWS